MSFTVMSMRHLFMLGLLLLPLGTGCRGPISIGGPSGLSVGAAKVSTTQPQPSAAYDDHNLNNSLLGLSLFAVDGLLSGGLGPAAWISYDEVRFVAGRLRSDRAPFDVFGLGVDMSKSLGPRNFVHIGFWVLEEDRASGQNEHSVGRLELDLGHSIELGESTHLVGSLGITLERSRQDTANFFSLTDDFDEGLFGSRHDQFGGRVELGVRQRLGKWLEVDAGLRGETLRRDSEGYFVNARVFLSRNVALFGEYSDTDEQEFRVGISIVP